MTTATKPKLSKRIDSVCHALSVACDMAEEFTGPDRGWERPQITVAIDHSDGTGKPCVVISQGIDPDPADSLILSEKGLASVREGSTYLPWGKGQDAAFFAAVILAFTFHSEILCPPVCPDCAAETD